MPPPHRAALLLAVLAAACGGRQPAPPPPPARAGDGGRAAPAPARAAAPPAPPGGGWVGGIVARASVDLTAEAPGRLAAIHARVGDRVERGDRLATLDTRAAAQDLEMARSSLHAAEAEPARAAAEAAEARQRAERRHANPDFFSKEDMADSELKRKTSAAALDAAEARVGEQRARVRQLETAAGKNEIRAPFAGRVAERFVDAGAVVGPGTPILRLISGGDLLVRAAVPPEQARALAVGKAVTARVPTLGLDVPGHLERIAPQVDAAAQMIFVEARLDPTPAAAERLQTGLVVDLRPGG